MGGVRNTVSATVWVGGLRVWKNGGGEGFRTPGPRLMSPLLYQLSYTATFHDGYTTWDEVSTIP